MLALQLSALPRGADKKVARHLLGRHRRPSPREGPKACCCLIVVQSYLGQLCRQRTVEVAMKQIFSLVLMLPFLLQNPNSMTPEERAKLETQNNQLKAMLQSAKKLPYEANQISVHVPEKEGTMSLVSWIAGDRNGLIYLLQRDPKIDPVI